MIVKNISFNFQLAGDPILNFVLAVVADTPVCLFLLFALEKMGCRLTLCLTHVTLGLACIGNHSSTILNNQF
jgi:hypothetical protein